MFMSVLAVPLLAGQLASGTPIQHVGGAVRVCALPEVMQAVADALRGRGQSGEIDTRNPGQISDGGPIASCSVRFIQHDYDTNVRGAAPRFNERIQNFQVRRMPHSLTVELIL